MKVRFLIAGCAAISVCAAMPVRGQSELPDGPGKSIVQTACTQCHAIANVTRAGYSHDGWANVVAMMRNNGAHVPDDQVAAVVDYLANGATIEGKHRRPTGHRFDHHQPERLRPIDRDQQHDCTA